MAETKMTRQEVVAADAAAAVVEARQVLEQWHRRIDDAQADLQRLEADSGNALLDDPEKAASWPAQVREARDQAWFAERAAAAQDLRVLAVERAWCGAQAAMLETVEVVPARKALQIHQDRTLELLAALEEHNGPYVPRIEYARAQRAMSTMVDGVVTPALVVGSVTTEQMPKDYGLQVALVRAQVRHDVLAAMAEGDDPTGLVAGRSFADEISDEECYLEGVRAAGLVPAPAYASRVSSARALVAELEQLPGVLEGEMVELEERAMRGQLEPDAAAAGVVRRQARIEEVPDQLDAARHRLASLTGKAG